jgi:arylsulfatase A-like enzyme
MLPLEDNSIIIITSDHGEEFLDHKHIGHRQTLFEEVILVPLIVKLPDGTTARKVIDQPVSNKDILPTILDAIGEKIPEGIGRSFLPLITGDAQDAHGPVYAELDITGYWKSIRSGKWKFMFRGLKRRSLGRLNRGQSKPKIIKQRFLYDLQTDPRETKNLLRRQPDIAQRLESELDQWIKTNPVFKPPKTNVSLKKEEEEKLRSLGYLK